MPEKTYLECTGHVGADINRTVANHVGSICIIKC